MSGKYPQSASERYLTDVNYKRLVDMMEHMIHMDQFTPSEMREAAIVASINYESKRIRPMHIIMTTELHQELQRFHEIIDKAPTA